MGQKVLIGLFCNNLDPVPFYNGCEVMPIEIMKFTEKGINWKNKRIKGIILRNGHWVEAEMRFPDVVYNRCYTSSVKMTRRLEKVIGKGKVFNAFTLFDKHLIFHILSKSSLKDFIIPTFSYSPKTLLALLKKEGKALIKPAKGSMASHVYKIASEEGKFKVYLHTSLSPKCFDKPESLIRYLAEVMKRRKFIIQPFIEFFKVNGHMFDMRLLVQKNGKGLWDVTADISRVCYKESFVSNIVYALKTVKDALVGTGYEDTLLPRMKKIAIVAAKILDKNLYSLGEISVDFGIGADGRLWIIEMNGKPYKLVYQEISSDAFQKVFRMPMEYALYLAGK